MDRSQLLRHGTDDGVMWRLDHLDGLEVLHASFATHEFPKHMHPTYVIEVVDAGADEFTCGDQTHRAEGDDVVVINPFEIHTGKPVGPVPLAYRSIYPSLEQLAGVVRWMGLAEGRAPFFSSRVIQDSELVYRLRAFHHAVAGGEPAAEVRLLWYEAARVLIERHADEGADGRSVFADRVPVERARRHLIAHAARNVALEELADVAGLSPFHLSRCFRHQVGLPPHQYLINLRVEHCRQLLARGCTIAESSSRVGFSDQAHVTRCFHRMIGITPGRYRRSKIVQDSQGPRP